MVSDALAFSATPESKETICDTERLRFSFISIHLLGIILVLHLKICRIFKNTLEFSFEMSGGFLFQSFNFLQLYNGFEALVYLLKLQRQWFSAWAAQRNLLRAFKCTTTGTYPQPLVLRGAWPPGVLKAFWVIV